MKKNKLNKLDEKLKKKNDKAELKECIVEHDLVGKVKGEINREKRRIKREENKRINEPPHLKTIEEIGNSITHGVGCLFAIASFVLMLVFSKTGWHIFAACFYGISMILTMLNSCLYHSFMKGTSVKRLWRRFDYSSIYLLIGGTFAPLLLVDLGGILGIVLFCVQWVVIITGVTLICVFGPGRLRKLHFALYFSIGWIGLLLIPHFIINNNILLMIYVLVGGFIYTVGMIPFSLKVRNSHFIWHFFVLGGAIIQWIGIFIYLYC